MAAKVAEEGSAGKSVQEASEAVGAAESDGFEVKAKKAADELAVKLGKETSLKVREFILAKNCNARVAVEALVASGYATWISRRNGGSASAPPSPASPSGKK
jgi:hypothetical protein